MSIQLTDLLEEIVSKISSRLVQEEETPAQPPKRKRGRPSKADIAARAAAQKEKELERAASDVPRDVYHTMKDAKKRKAERDAATMAAAKAELDAAMKKEKGTRVKTTKGTVSVQPLPRVDEESDKEHAKKMERDIADYEEGGEAAHKKALKAAKKRKTGDK